MRAIIETVEKLYPTVTSFGIDGGVYKGFDKDGKEVTIDKTAVDTEHAKGNYKDARLLLYPSWRDFADAMYWNSKGDSTKLEEYYAACEKVKSDNPKPS